MIERDDWERVDALLQGALDLPGPERRPWLEEACAGDTALRDRVFDLLRLAEDEGDGLEPGGALRAAGPSDPAMAPPGGPDAPALAPGYQLGRYEIRSLLGSGGMGRVYCARDPMLDREVAIKTLAEAFRDDSASLRRFEREARLLAALSHPNIAAIYGFEVLEGSPYLVLERVEGGTLADRLGSGPLTPAEATSIAIQVAEGLAEAHAKGVIHRDLKPSNVMLTTNGRVKLVDFGLAKGTAARGEEAAAANPTTVAGAVLGTAPYMSPEQIHGEEVDTRTDIWAFGCLLYEMLCAEPAFPGRSLPEVLAAVLRDEPDWDALPRGVPAPIRRLLARCLRKDPRQRLQHIGDARLDLIELGGDSGIPAGVAFRPPRAWRWIALAAAALLPAVAAVLWLGPRWSTPPPRVLRLSLELPRGVALAEGFSAPFAIAPEGSHLVLEAAEGGTSRLYLRTLDDLALHAIPGTEGAHQPVFSPDGRWVAFFAERKLEKVPLEGGPPMPLCDIGSNPRGAAWAPDGTIVLAPSQRSGLLRVSDRGGRPEALTTLDPGKGEYSHRWPEVVPGKRWILFAAAVEDSTFDEARLEAVSLENGERRVVLAGAGYGRFLSGDRLLFVRGGRVYAVGFDAERLETRGDPEAVLAGVRYDPQNGGTHLAASLSGVLVYGPGIPASPDVFLAWLGRDARLARLGGAARSFRDPRLSPDGNRVAVVIGAGAESDLWVVEADGTLSRLSFGLAPRHPAWTPDGRRITVGAEKDGVWSLHALAADGRGETSVLLEGRNRAHPNAWSPDGRYLVFQESRPGTGWDLLRLEVDGAGRPAGPPQPVAATPFYEANASISPDGRWVAYESDEVDALVQAQVRSFPAGREKVQGSTGGARWPAWGRDRTLYYWDTSRHLLRGARTREAGERLLLEDAGPLLEGDDAREALARVVISVTGARFDVHPSEDRILVMETSAASVEPPLSDPVVVLDWADPLRTRLPL